MNQPPPSEKPRIEHYLELVTPFVVLLILIWSLAYLVTHLRSHVMVEPVSVPKTMADSGLTDLAAQRALVTALQAVISDARDTMPGEIKDQVQADEPEVSIVVPGTGVSLQSIIDGTKAMLPFHDVTIRSAILEQGKEKYIARVYVTDASSDVGSETTPPSDPLAALGDAALAIMQMHNKFIYASAVAARARKECYQKGKCDFGSAIDAFEAVLQDDAYERFHRWSWLALSKIDEDQGNFTGETTKALLAVRQDRRFFWAYYNWGVGLSEQACDEEALEAFEAARKYRPFSDFVNNAAGRQALILAGENEGVDDIARAQYLERAHRYLTAATDINLNYAEAYVNLARTSRQLQLISDQKRRTGGKPDNIPYKEEAIDAIDTVLLADSDQVQRAYIYASSWKPLMSRGLDLPPERAASAIGALIHVYRNVNECESMDLADSILETKGCFSYDDEQENQFHGAQLVAVRRDRKKWPGEDACHNQSVRKNIKDVAPQTPEPII